MERGKSKSEMEAEMNRAIIRFEKEFMGRGPLETRSYLLGDLLLVRLRNVLTPAEVKLANAGNPQRGRYLLKQLRQQLIEEGRPMLNAIVKKACGVACVSLHTDISTKTGERIIVFTLEHAPDIRPLNGGRNTARQDREDLHSKLTDKEASRE